MLSQNDQSIRRAIQDKMPVLSNTQHLLKVIMRPATPASVVSLPSIASVTEGRSSSLFGSPTKHQELIIEDLDNQSDDEDSYSISSYGMCTSPKHRKRDQSIGSGSPSPLSPLSRPMTMSHSPIPSPQYKKQAWAPYDDCSDKKELSPLANQLNQSISELELGNQVVARQLAKSPLPPIDNKRMTRQHRSSASLSMFASQRATPSSEGASPFTVDESKSVTPSGYRLA